MYDDILLPTDGSAGMGEVIDHTLELADIHDATVHAIYVLNTASLNDLPMESSWDGLNDALEKEGRTAINEIERKASDADLVTEITEGSPSKEIINYATEEGCDLIVMGTHGRSGVDRLLLGSVAERVVRSSTLPVMTIQVTPGEADS